MKIIELAESGRTNIVDLLRDEIRNIKSNLGKVWNEIENSKYPIIFKLRRDNALPLKNHKKAIYISVDNKS